MTSVQLPFFVYGTLQTGFKNHANVVKGRYSHVQNAQLHFARVYHFPKAGFPGCWRCDDEASTVLGQLLTVPTDVYTAVLEDLDMLEDFFGPGHPNNMYEREQVVVQGADGLEHAAWVYFCRIEQAAYEAVLVPHGDWRKYMRETGATDAGDDWADVLQRAQAAAEVSRGGAAAMPSAS